MSALDFHIDASDPASRQLRVTLECPREAFRVAGQEACQLGDAVAELFQPTWTPGSYLIREYSRHLSSVRAEDADSGTPLPCAKVAKNRFRLELAATTRRVRVSYSVYAHELTVRTADLTDIHAFWNHACILLWPVGQAHLPCNLRVTKPTGWHSATTLRRGPPHAGGESWTANNLDEVIDSPVLLGKFLSQRFEVHGVVHTVVLEGLAAVPPPKTLVADLVAIVQAAAAVFGNRLPYENYLFLCLFADEGYGGLEHTSSSTVLMGRTALTSDKGYREFLALCAHELFHAWNIKRMRPTELWTYDYECENYTSLLWLAEGWTAYYDDLLCLRAGLTTAEQYLQVVAKNIDQLRNATGRRRLSLADSSFDAWIRLYRPDENTRNSSQNYYVNGSVTALCLDLLIRRESNGERSIDDVMRDLYQGTFAMGRGYDIGDVAAAVGRAGGQRAADLLITMVRGELDPPLEDLLGSCGVRLSWNDRGKPHLGVTFAGGSTRIAAVTDETAAARAGLHPGDEVLALNNLRVTNETWQEVQQGVAVQEVPLEVLLCRRGVVKTIMVTPTRGPGATQVTFDGNADEERIKLRTSWLRRAEPRPQPGASAPSSPIAGNPQQSATHNGT